MPVRCASDCWHSAPSSTTNPELERESQADLEAARARRVRRAAAAVIRARRELEEVVRRERGHRRAPVWMIEEVHRLDAQLRREPAHAIEALEQREVQVPDRRTAEAVASAVAEPGDVETRRLREQRLVVVSLGARAHRANRLGIAADVDA